MASPQPRPKIEPESPLPEAATVEIAEVADKAALDRFIRLPWSIYAGDPNWVPPLILERRAHLDRKANPFFSHAEAGLWLARRGGRDVGRISAQVDRAHLERHGDAAGFFGFLEAIDDQAVFAALLRTAEAWLAGRGMVRARGPFSWSINDESGLLVDGFDTPPSLLMGHARPYYAGRVEACGYAKVKDLIAYDFAVAPEAMPPVAGTLIKRLKRREDVTIRSLDKRRFSKDLDAVLDIFNDAWSDNWGYVPLSDAEIAKAAKDLAPIIHADLVAIVEVGGEPAAFAIALPNLNEAIADLNGRLLPFGWAKLLYRLKFGRLRSARMPLMGVRKKYQNGPLGAALAYAVIERVYKHGAARGILRGELSWILEDNLPVRRIIEDVGGRPYKTYRIYEKALA